MKIKITVLTAFLLLSFVLAGCVGQKSWKKESSYIDISSQESVSHLIKPRKYISLPSGQALTGQSADVLLEVDSVKLRFGELMAYVKQYGGSVVNSQIAKIDGSKYFAYIIVKLPKRRFGDCLKDMNSNGTVLKQGVVNRENPFNLNDIKLKLKNCAREEDRLKNLLKKTKSAADIIKYEKRLSELREKRLLYKSEFIQGKTFYWFSTINLYLREADSGYGVIIIIGLVILILLIIGFILARRQRKTVY